MEVLAELWVNDLCVRGKSVGVRGKSVGAEK